MANYWQQKLQSSLQSSLQTVNSTVSTISTDGAARCGLSCGNLLHVYHDSHPVCFRQRKECNDGDIKAKRSGPLTLGSLRQSACWIQFPFSGLDQRYLLCFKSLQSRQDGWQLYRPQHERLGPYLPHR